MSKACPFCGNNPVPHRFYWYNESLNILLTPLRQKLLYNPLTAVLKKSGWDASFSRFFLALGQALGLATLQKDSQLCKVRRAQVLWEEGKKRGIEMAEVLLFGRPIDVYVAKFKTKDLSLKTIVFSGLPRPEGYTNHRLDLMDDKWLFKKIMMENNLPVPMGSSCSNFNQAKQIFAGIRNSQSVISNSKLAIPIIVKPRAGSRGRHTTTFVFTEEQLKQAFKIAKRLCYWVMVERQLLGPVYRATVINGHLAGVLRGDPPQVVGDGVNNIGQLIDVKNSRPHPGVKDIIVGDETKRFLARQQLDLLSVPPAGTIINLSEKIGVNYGGGSSEDFDICHPENKELFLRAAEALGDPIVGFDFIIPDIAKSYKNQDAGFIEVNSLPFINLHHDPLHGESRNAAGLIWDMLGW